MVEGEETVGWCVIHIEGVLEVEPHRLEKGRPNSERLQGAREGWPGKGLPGLPPELDLGP